MIARRFTLLVLIAVLCLLSMAPVVAESPQPEFGTNWTANYFNNVTLQGSPVFTEMFPTGINVNWGMGSPNPAIWRDNWSARFTSSQIFNQGAYEFVVSSDDGVRVFIDGVLVWDRFIGRVLTTDRFQLNMNVGIHQVTVEYVEFVDQAAIQFQYFMIPSLSTINGRVTNALGAGLPGATVNAYNAATGQFAAATTTNTDGSYALPVNPNTYRVTAGATGYLTEYYNDKYNFWSADNVSTAASSAYNINFQLEQPACISGTLTLPDGVTPAAFDQIYVYRAGNPVDSSYYDATYYGVTNANGVYTVCNLVPGQYRVQATDPDGIQVTTFYNGQLVINAAALITVMSGGNVTNLNFSYFAFDGSAPVLNVPAGMLNNAPPAFEWNAVEGGDWYHVWVSDQDGYVFSQWYDGWLVCANDTCSVPNADALESGSYRWWGQAWGSTTGYGEWSAPTWFYIPFAGAPTPITSGRVEQSNLPLTWEKLPGAMWYQLWVTDPDGGGAEYWFDAWNVCGTGDTCTAPSITLGHGIYRWWVRAWNLDLGLSEWSAETFFALPPHQPVTGAPVGMTNNNNPVFEWQPIKHADWYFLYVNNGQNENVIAQWFPASQICTTGCAAPSPLALSTGWYTWWVQPYNPVSGYGSWSNPTVFTINVEATPDAPPPETAP